MQTENLELPPALLDYYARINAEVLTFNRAIVKVASDQYYVAKCLIRVLTDGTLKVSDKTYAPTDDEASAIRTQWLQFSPKYPKPIEATESGALIRRQETEHDLKRRGAREIITHLFHNRATSAVTMLQQRFWDSNGNRQFVPHTFWSDGQWRTIEPDSLLPFWKPKTARKARIMVHEGAKAAEVAERIALDRQSDHPWRAALARYEHWGLSGGAMAPQRTNFEELRRERPEEVIYCCDNDFPGKEALQKVSQLYGGQLKSFTPNARWPLGWDMADPIPENCFEEGLYQGPPFEELLKPATWVTEQVPSQGPGRPAYELRAEFVKEWWHSVVPDAYVHRDFPDQIRNQQQFDDLVAPFCHASARNIAHRIKARDVTKGVRMVYAPNLGSGLINEGKREGGLLLNTYQPPPQIRAVEGDATPFLEFMTFLIPLESDRTSLLKWITTLVSRPDIKMTYAVLLVSDIQGVGKSTLGDRILMPLVGERNTSTPGESDIVESQFNGWAAHKRLAVIHEIYAGHSSKAYNKLKSIITDRKITVNIKYMQQYMIDNWLHIFACSNSLGALRLSVDDRRWFVPKVSTNTRTLAYWTAFNHWLTHQQGLGIIKGWCDARAQDIYKIVMPGAIAPMSSTKEEMIQEGFSEGMQLAFKVLSILKQEAEEKGELRLVLDTDLVRMSKELIHHGRSNQFLEKPLTMRKVAKALGGWRVSEHKITYRGWGKNGQDPQAYVVDAFNARALIVGPNASMLAEFPPAKIVELIAPTDVIEVARVYNLIPKTLF
jgi:hypothetical protein